MTGDFAMSLLPITGMVVNTVVQFISFKTVLGRNLLRSLLVGYTAGFAYICVISWVRFSNGQDATDDTLAYFLVNQISYFALWFCFFNYINLGETARRVRLMRELISSPQGLTYDELRERYNAREMVQRRLQRLLSKGQAVRRGDRLYSGKPVVLFIAKVVLAFKLLILSKRSEFD